MLDLGLTPLANSLLATADGPVAPRYPLTLLWCSHCSLVQLGQIVAPRRLFSDYVYYSSYSDTMLQHAKTLADALISSEGLTRESMVIEIASNDGYLLQYFVARGIPVLGIEPAQNIAAEAQARGIPTLPAFFDEATGIQIGNSSPADVVIGNNVLAHVPDLNGFVAGVAKSLKRTGVAVFEFPYLANMLSDVEFDTIYHEHQCYFSLTALKRLFEEHGLEPVSAERIPIHGGSLRVTFAHQRQRHPRPNVTELLVAEAEMGVQAPAMYQVFRNRVLELKEQLVDLIEAFKRQDMRIAGYGAAAKGVTLTSFCGIGKQHIDYLVDRSPHKQGHFFPVGPLEIFHPNTLLEDHPETTLLLTWNFADEILEQQKQYTSTGGKFIIPVPLPRLATR